MSRPFLLIALFGLLPFQSGCESKPAAKTNTPAAAPKPVLPTEDAEAVKAIDAAAKKVGRDSDGLITLVDYRGQTIDDTSLESLVGLPRLQKLYLSDTAISDAGLMSVGKITTLENLELGGCAISNDGLAHLAGLSKLKLLKLSGKNGKCSVDDDGLEHLAGLSNLKVLALDHLG